jgi:hypothetical protein
MMTMEIWLTARYVRIARWGDCERRAGMNENAIDRNLVCAFIGGLISDDGEREKGLEYIRSMPPVNPTKTGWIPVSERLPEESIKQIMLGDEHTSDFVLVTIKGQTYPFPKAKVKVARYSYTYKAWQIANNNFGKVVAWMPLPPCYEPQERSDKQCR